ncbi:hypothetical protein ACFQV4_01400 [Streptomyces thermocarboxydus]
MMKRVEANRQLLLFGERDAEPEQQDVGDGIPTWFLLYHHARTDQGTRLHAELSFPNAPGNRGKISSWHERIILPGSTSRASPRSSKTSTTTRGASTFRSSACPDDPAPPHHLAPPMTTASRLVLARKRRGLTVTRLAQMAA